MRAVGQVGSGAGARTVERLLRGIHVVRARRAVDGGEEPVVDPPGFELRGADETSRQTRTADGRRAVTVEESHARVKIAARDGGVAADRVAGLPVAAGLFGGPG